MIEKRAVWVEQILPRGKGTLEILVRNFGADIAVDAIRMDGMLDAFIITDVLVDDRSQVVRELKANSISTNSIIETLNKILGAPKKMRVPAKVFEAPLVLKLDTAKERVTFKVENIALGPARLAVHLIERTP